MANGIVCKVWNIQGNTSAKGAAAQLGDSIGYILNDEKTDYIFEMKDSDISNPMAQLERECKYVENDIKTVSRAFVGSHNLVSTDIKDAVAEMMSVKEFYGKTDGRAALHGIISLPEAESNMQNAANLLKLCERVMKEVFPNNQAIFGVHTNTENLHVHFIINSVGVDGKKIHQNDKFIKDVLHPCINKYAKQFGFSQNLKWAEKNIANKKSFPEIKVELRKQIDFAIERSDNFTDFVNELKQSGIAVNVGKYISLKSDEIGKPIRTHNLGSNYTKEMIVERIATRTNAFVKTEINNYTMKNTPKEIFIPTIVRMQKYKDMTPEQKEYVLRQLRLGNNPWRSHQQMNWQLNNIADQLNTRERILSYIDFYSKDGSLQGAMDGIIAAKKAIAKEKKIVTEQRKKYKPIIDIYKEMKPLQRKAYLYEHENVTEYRPQFEQYRILTRRLKDGYNKDVWEIANFERECEERLTYAHAQLNELSMEYREIKQYANKHGIRAFVSGHLVDAVGLYDNIENEKMHVFNAESFFIASHESDMLIRLVKSPGYDSKGKIVEQYFLSIINDEGKIVEQLDSINTQNKKDFAQVIYNLEEKYHMTECQRFSNLSLAREYMSAGKKEKNNEKLCANLAQTSTTNPKFVSFTQAVNYCGKSRSGECIIADSVATEKYYAKAKQNDNKIVIEIFDNKRIFQESIAIPLLSEKTEDGYLRMIELQNKYGFSDSLITFENEKEAENYIQVEKEQKNIDEDRNREGWRL
jgi:hypothetical protein